jgi:hypothetical protein
MQLREDLSQTGRSLTDIIHLIGTGVTVFFILLIIGFGSAADGKWFRIYSYATIVILLVAGTWGAMDAPLVEANLPTPWLGVKERINIYGYIIWLAMMAVTLLRTQVTSASRKPPANIGAPQLTPR